MTPEVHRLKAERITRSLAKCTVRDYEIVIEGAMLAGTHWFKLGLHQLGITPVAKDVMHAEFLPKSEHFKVSLCAPEMLAAMEAIEGARELFVRGSAPDGEEAARKALECLACIRERALAAQPIRDPR